MQALFNHIERMKTKPHHVRKQVAFMYAAVGTGLIALVWFIANLSAGSFAIKNTSFADSVAQTPVVTVPEQSSGLAGAAGAASTDASAPAHIEIVNTTPTPAPKAEPTTLPF